MNKLFFSILIMGMVSILNFTVQGQSTIKEVIIVEFESPHDVVTLLVDDEQVDYQVTEKTAFKNKKRRKVSQEFFTKGCEIDVKYAIKNRERVALELKLRSNKKAGSENFKGVFELQEDDMVYIDGRKVKLSNDATIDCSGKTQCGCSKGASYIDFSELDKGDFVTIKGKSGPNGTVIANQIIVCKNEYTETDRKLRTAVESSYSATGTRVVAAPTGIVVPPNSLHQGNIKIGTLEYPLANDIKLQGYVNVVGNKILPDYVKEESYQKKHNIFFRFYVIDNPIPNAFAFPNGMVFIHTGLMQLMENEAQLATVLGHEIAHVTYEHSSSRAKNQGLVNLAAANENGKKRGGKLKKWVKEKVGLKEDGIGDDVLGGVGNSLANTKPSDVSNLFEKSKETQADRVGLMYMYLAGYDVRESVSFWQLMSQKTGDETFQSKLAADTKTLLVSNVLTEKGNTLSSLTEEATGMVVGNYLETIYTSHPLTKKRLRDINQLLLTTYEGENFDQYRKGEEKYSKYTLSIK